MARQTRPVVRAHSSAPQEKSTLSVRPPRFYELALPMIPVESGDSEAEAYPPPNGMLKLTSKGGYQRAFKVSSGVCMGDDFCSFRFDDIDESYKDDEFTATLEWDDEKETIFENEKVATFILDAQEKGKYEPPFNPGDEEQTEQGGDDDSDASDEGEVDAEELEVQKYSEDLDDYENDQTDRGMEFDESDLFAESD